MAVWSWLANEFASELCAEAPVPAVLECDDVRPESNEPAIIPIPMP